MNDLALQRSRILAQKCMSYPHTAVDFFELEIQLGQWRKPHAFYEFSPSPSSSSSSSSSPTSEPSPLYSPTASSSSSSSSASIPKHGVYENGVTHGHFQAILKSVMRAASITEADCVWVQSLEEYWPSENIRSQLPPAASHEKRIYWLIERQDAVNMQCITGLLEGKDNYGLRLTAKHEKVLTTRPGRLSTCIYAKRRSEFGWNKDTNKFEHIHALSNRASYQWILSLTRRRKGTTLDQALSSINESYEVETEWVFRPETGGATSHDIDRIIACLIHHPLQLTQFRSARSSSSWNVSTQLSRLFCYS